MAKTTYEVTLPDGSTHTRASGRTCTHAVVAQGARGWALMALCESPALAEERITSRHRRAPTEPAQVVPARVVVPLTERQRQFLTEIGDHSVEMFGTGHLISLVKRGLVERRFIGMRWWCVRRTEAGRRAVEAPA